MIQQKDTRFEIFNLLESVVLLFPQFRVAKNNRNKSRFDSISRKRLEPVVLLSTTVANKFDSSDAFNYNSVGTGSAFVASV